ncbi:MAG: hypothetical protein ACLQVK_25600 [Acidimicrobiales bacterium]
MGGSSPVYIETGAKRVFACSLEWPGLCRVAKTEEAALLALSGYAGRYAAVVAGAGAPAGPGSQAGWVVVERVPTRSGGADFGAPTTVLERDYQPVSTEEAARTSALLTAAWELFDEVVAGAPASLRKGPRGGGRDRDAIVGHVAAAEQMFAQRVGFKLPAPGPGERAVIEANRAAILDWCRGGQALATARSGWPPRYAARRLLWHVLDHAWEIEDRSPGTEDHSPETEDGRQ